MRLNISFCYAAALFLSLPLTSHGAVKAETTVASLPNFSLSEDHILKPIDPMDTVVSAPPGLEFKELLRLYSESLLAGAKKAGLPEASLKKCLTTSAINGIPFAAYSVRYKDRACWLIGLKNMGWQYTDTPEKMSHGSVKLIDATTLEVLYSDSCYCF
jgi:hypothetical protein